MFVKGRVDFKHIQIHEIRLLKEKLTLDMSKYVQIWLLVCLSKEKLTLDMTICGVWVYLLEEKLTLSMFVKGKVDFRYMSKHDFECVC
jgi:hypothetical protein